MGSELSDEISYTSVHAPEVANRSEVGFLPPESPSPTSPPSSPPSSSQFLYPENYPNPQSIGLLNPRLSEPRRHQLDVINRLHSLGAQLDIDIPQIVVIGSQSAGKSSLIESISGITLPRSSGTCTRCPTECRLIHSAGPWECLVSLRFMTDELGHLLQRVRNVSFGQPIRDPKDVEERLRKAQRAALNPGSDPQLFLESNQFFHSNALDFTTNCISLEIRSPDVTDLSFCDLPGLIASVSEGGRDEDVEKVTQLVSSYISKPSCIILLTVACESDFETQGAYRLAKKHDVNGTRTIGVLTKPDRIPDGEETRWIKLIKNENARLKNGWYCVKQPSTAELEKKITFQEARRRGETFFTNPPWSKLEGEHQKRLGALALTQKLNEYLMALIAKRFPELMRELQNVLQRTKDDLRKIPPPASKDPVMELYHLIGDFSDDMFRHAEGISYDISSKASVEGNQFESIGKAHEAFRKWMRATAPDFRPFENEEPQPVGLEREANPHERDVVHIFDCDTRPPSRCSIDCALTPLAPVQVLAPDPPFLECEEVVSSPNSGNPIYLNQVVQQVRKATTRELSGYYPFKVLQDLIFCSTSQWEEPAHLLVESIYRIVLDHHNALVEKHFGKYTAGGLQQRIFKIVLEYTQKCRDEAALRVKWLLEMEAHAFTLNTHYLNNYRDKFLEFYKEQRRSHFGRHTHLAAEPWHPNQYGLEIMATVRAYFQVAYKRVVDTLPLAIDRELVRVQKKDLQETISLGLGITGSEASQFCERFLAEPSEVIERREELRNKLERLTNAQGELVPVDA